MSFHYLFKFIVIGDTGNNSFTQGSENLASYNSSSNKKSTRNMMSRSEYSSQPKPSKSTKKSLNYKFGIPPDNRISDLLHALIIVAPLELF